jgi:hypothetical protein
MFYYKGAKEMGYIQPRTLASYDIVITTYETLGTASRFRSGFGSESVWIRIVLALLDPNQYWKCGFERKTDQTYPIRLSSSLSEWLVPT